MEPYQLVAADMDGTLLTSSTTLSPATIDFVRTLSDRGILFAVATGRPAPSMQPHIDTLGVALPCILFNGACLMHMRPGLPPTPLWESALSDDLAAAVVGFAHGQAGLCVSWSMRGSATALVTSEAHRAQLSRYEELEGVEQRVVETPAALLAQPHRALKIVALSESPDEDYAAAVAALGGRGDVHVIRSQMHIEFVAKGVNKAAALDVLCERLMVPIDDCIALGDGMNDAEMLGAVGLGVAVRNASKEAKEAADEVAPLSNDQDAVARCTLKIMEEGNIVGWVEASHKLRQANRARAAKERGNTHFKAAEFGAALECYSVAIDAAEPDRLEGLATYYANRAACHAKMGEHDEVVADCDAVLAIDPT